MHRPWNSRDVCSTAPFKAARRAQPSGVASESCVKRRIRSVMVGSSIPNADQISLCSRKAWFALIGVRIQIFGVIVDIIRDSRDNGPCYYIMTNWLSFYTVAI